MVQRNRKYARNIDELPGLFDIQRDEDVYAGIIAAERNKQTTPRRTLNRETMIEMNRRISDKMPELEFFSMGSGSSGNCAYVGIRGGKGVIVDAGVHPDTVLQGLSDNYILPENITGIILTHDHSDHVRYVYSLVRKLRTVQVYCTPRTLNGILRRHSISSRLREFHKPIFKEFEFECAGMTITPFEVSHDGTDNVGFSITAKTKTFVIATDMGMIGDRADHYMRQANFLMIETNYDDHMLTVGKYQEYLKARIRGDRGHLDNKVTAEYLKGIWNPGLTHIYLCHLSNDNNTPQIARSCVTDALTSLGIAVGDASGSSEAVKADVQVFALPRYDVSPLFIHRL